MKGEFKPYGNQKNRNEISSKARYEVSVQNCSEEINQDDREENGRPKKGSEEDCREEGREESTGQEDSYQKITTLRFLSAFA